MRNSPRNTEKRSCRKAPFVLDFGAVLFARGTVESGRITPEEFYDEGLNNFSTGLLFMPFQMMLDEFIFPAFVSLGSIAIAFFCFRAGDTEGEGGTGLGKRPLGYA